MFSALNNRHDIVYHGLVMPKNAVLCYVWSYLLFILVVSRGADGQSPLVDLCSYYNESVDTSGGLPLLGDVSGLRYWTVQSEGGNYEPDIFS